MNVDYGIFIDLVDDVPAYAKYRARVDGITERYFAVMHRIGWRRLYRTSGPWYRPR